MGELGIKCNISKTDNFLQLISTCESEAPRIIAFKTESYLTHGISLIEQLVEQGRIVRTNADFPQLSELFPEVVNENDEIIYIISVERLLFILFQAQAPSSLNTAAVREILEYHGHTKMDETSLSNSEKKVLRELTRGKSYKMIAITLNVSLETVKSHLKAIYRKLGVSNSTAAVSTAFQDGLV